MEQMSFGLDVGSPGVASGGNNAADRQASVQPKAQPGGVLKGLKHEAPPLAIRILMFIS